MVVSITLGQGFAHSYGPAPRVTGAPGDSPQACTVCHAGAALNSGAGSVNIVLQGGAVYVPGVKQRVMVQVSDPVQQRWGFELTARLNSDLAKGQAGDLSPVDNLTQVICEDFGPKPCSSGVQFIQHTSAGTRIGTKGGAIFQFDWTPPATNAGPVTLYVAGNAANGDRNLTGDLIYTSNVQLTPAIAAAPTVMAGNIVSAATSVAGPVAPNSWVTIFGANLSATTRSWTDGDFNNGGMPNSLDGVSVILTAFGAPRLASIAYISPTQINFLMPSDASSTTYQVQVRNPAGISAQLPLTVQANAVQLLTTDGKYVAATHANGSLVSKTSPAAPGETVSFYATGCGATTPALTPSQVPPQAAALVTLPSVSVGNLPSAISFGGVLPGVGGVCQLNAQVGSNVANGDQPVQLQSGTFVSAAPLITVQK